MITGRQVRAARALLNWKQDMLAEKALVALTALKRLESERGLPVHETTRDQVRRALESAGIMFVESDRGKGVMLLNDAPPAATRRPAQHVDRKCNPHPLTPPSTTSRPPTPF